MTAILIFLAVLTGLALLPFTWRLTLSLWSSIFQLYTIPVLGFYPSFTMLTTLSLTPRLMAYKRTLTQWPVIFFIALMATQAMSLLWSPDHRLGLATIFYESPFLILYIIAFNLAHKNPSQFFKLLKGYVMLSLIPLLPIIAFRIFYNLNIEFLKSSFATFFINPHTLTWYFSQSGHENWHSQLYFFSSHKYCDWISPSYFQPNFGGWTNKPRGFFINPNVGGGYLGICALLFWGIGTYYRSFSIKLIGVLHWLTLFIILSTAAMGLAIVLPITIIAIFILSEMPQALSTKNISKFTYGLGGLLLTSLVLIVNYSDILVFFLYKLKSRLIFWKIAATLFHTHPVTGLGFGGWDIFYEKYRETNPSQLLLPHLPPHDFLIQLWSQSGLFAVVSGLLFIISMLWFCFRAFKLFPDKQTKLFVLCVTGGLLWVFLQGLSENWGIIGEMHIQPIFAITFGLMMGLYYRKREELMLNHA